MNTRDLVAFCKISDRQVQWWCDHGILHPTFKGHDREFSEDEVLRTLITAALKHKGVPLQRIRSVLEGQRSFPEEWMLVNPHGKHLTVVWCRNPQEVLEIFKRSQSGMVVVGVGELKERIKKNTNKLGLVKRGGSTEATTATAPARRRTGR